jgi:hypothetical protein
MGTSISSEEPVVVPLEAVRLFVKLGTLSAVSRELNISLRDLTRASRQIWWQDEVILLRREQQAALDASFTKLHNQTVAELIDRVENGEQVYSKKGVLVRVPMKARDIAAVAHIIFTERQLLRNEPTAIQGDSGKVQVLADKLRLLGKTMLPPEDDVIDASPALGHSSLGEVSDA